MDDLDAQIGKNLSRLRGDLSQADLAKEMKERGYKWSQATVWAVEKGERPVRLAEAVDLAKIFDKDVSVLLRNETEAALINVIQDQMKRVGASSKALSEAVRVFEGEKENLRATLVLANHSLERGLIAENFKQALKVHLERAEAVLDISATQLARNGSDETVGVVDGEHSEEA